MLDSGRTLMIACTCLAITACGIPGNKRNADPATPTSTAEHEHDNWFCQADEARNSWDCVQRPRLAMKSIPARLKKQPEPEPSPIATMPSSAALDLPMLPDPEKVPAGRANAGPADAGVRTATPSQPPAPAPALEPNPASAEPQDRKEFGHLPAASIALNELPANFYVVQIVALSSMEALQSFASEHHLNHLPAARVEANGKFFYVLLLGAYETLKDANSAAASRPESLMIIEPWIRKLGSLQDAVVRANLLAGTPDY